jgi:hypothetical protein
MSRRAALVVLAGTALSTRELMAQEKHEEEIDTYERRVWTPEMMTLRNQFDELTKRWKSPRFAERNSPKTRKEVLDTLSQMTNHIYPLPPDFIAEFESDKYDPEQRRHLRIIKNEFMGEKFMDRPSKFPVFSKEKIAPLLADLRKHYGIEIIMEDEKVALRLHDEVNFEADASEELRTENLPSILEKVCTQMKCIPVPDIQKENPPFFTNTVFFRADDESGRFFQTSSKELRTGTTDERSVQIPDGEGGTVTSTEQLHFIDHTLRFHAERGVFTDGRLNCVDLHNQLRKPQ